LLRFRTTTHILFSFAAARPHPSLHSFPTRRSSDLRRHRFQRAERPPPQQPDTLGALPRGALPVARHLRRPLEDRLRPGDRPLDRDRKSTRLNSSHRTISYAVFCLKKKKKQNKTTKL